MTVLNHDQAQYKIKIKSLEIMGDKFLLKNRCGPPKPTKPRESSILWIAKSKASDNNDKSYCRTFNNGFCSTLKLIKIECKVEKKMSNRLHQLCFVFTDRCPPLLEIFSFTNSFICTNNITNEIKHMARSIINPLLMFVYCKDHFTTKTVKNYFNKERNKMLHTNNSCKN